MSTSLLCHAFGIRVYSYVRSQYLHGQIHFSIEQRNAPMRCRQCGSDQVIRRGTFVRRFRTLPIGGRQVWIVLPVQRVECQRCRVVQRVEVAFADRRRGYTRAFERCALELCRHMTIQDVADHLSVSWDVIKAMFGRETALMWRIKMITLPLMRSCTVTSHIGRALPKMLLRARRQAR